VDFDAALNLDARDTTALRNRGLARFFQRQFDLASQDFARRQRLTKAPDPYDVIWRYLAQARNEEVAGPTLAEHARQHADPAWPGPLIQLFLGGIGPQALDAATRDADAQVQVEQLCEANYYAGQWHLLRNEPAQAISRFRAAESGCPKLFLEYSGAVAELKRSR
jgi:lipoprotein NlpI